VSRITGNVTGVTSPLLACVDSSFNGECRGSSGSPNRFERDYRQVAPDVYVDASALIRDGANAPLGIVVRLTRDGDDPLVCSRVRVYETAAPKVTEGRTDIRPKLSWKQEQDAAVRAIAKAANITGPIDSVTRFAILKMLELEKTVTGKKIV
jgi:hypothetical protein